jgi:hypothetical protein
MDHCDGCKLYNLDITHRVCIPPPSNKIRGCLISRDPTSIFLGELKKYKQLSTDQREGGNLWFNAPPRWLFDKIYKIITESDDNYPDKTVLQDLQDFLKYECYWTHLHKCPTKPQQKQGIHQDGMNVIDENYLPFSSTTAKFCANNWFESEFAKYCLKDKIIITLGRDVEIFFKQWSSDHGLKNCNKIISLPHPSGRCRSWNKNSINKEHITKEITRLFYLLDADVK